MIQPSSVTRTHPAYTLDGEIMTSEVIRLTGELRHIIEYNYIVDDSYPHGQMWLITDNYNNMYVAVLHIHGKNFDYWVEFDPNENCSFLACECCNSPT